MSTTYTDLQLQRFLASCLPDKIKMHAGAVSWFVDDMYQGDVIDTEWLQIVWEVEEKLSNRDACDYMVTLIEVCGGSEWLAYHATWQQRTIALAQALGRRIDE